MKALLLLERIQVENANAISGMTWGFPAMTHFLGFTHALSRFTRTLHNVELGGCGVVCHWHQVKAHQPSGMGEFVFSLTRNPLALKGQDAVTAPFNEEGKMHFEASLLIECNFTPQMLSFKSGSPEEDAHLFSQQLQEKLMTMKLAGGDIISLKKVRFETLPDEDGDKQRWTKKKLLGLLPGFTLIDRSELLLIHKENLLKKNEDADALDVWLDFFTLKYRAMTGLSEEEDASEETHASWELVPKPAEGRLVPLMCGYQAISRLYSPNEIANSRDPSQPFRFVESVYGVGQWLSPHRIKKIEQLIWHYQQIGDSYLCINRSQSES